MQIFSPNPLLLRTLREAIPLRLQKYLRVKALRISAESYPNPPAWSPLFNNSENFRISYVFLYLKYEV